MMTMIMNVVVVDLIITDHTAAAVAVKVTKNSIVIQALGIQNITMVDVLAVDN